MATAPEIESLRDALHTVTDWDTEFVSLFGLEDKLSKSRRLRIAREQRVKQEREQLRAEIRRLEAVVDSYSLKGAHASGEASVLRYECRGIVKRQRALREKAEIENQRLRHVVKSLIGLARQLRVESVSMDVLPRVPDQYEGPTPDTSELLTHLDALASEATSVFSAETFATFHHEEFYDTSYHVGKSHVVQVEFVASWVLPFSVDEVAEAFWAHTTSNDHMGRSVNASEIYADATTLVSQYVSSGSPPQFMSEYEDKDRVVGGMHGRIATRRLTKAPDGSVLVISHASSKVMRLNGGCLGYMKGDSWMHAEPMATSAHISGAVTRIKWYRRFDGLPPEQFASTPTLRARWVRGILRKPMPLRWQKGLDSHVQAIEDRLLAVASKTRQVGKAAPF